MRVAEAPLRETLESGGYSTVEDGANDEIDAVRAFIAKLERSRQ